MDKYQILFLMTQEESQLPDCNPFSMAALLAEQLSLLSGKLDEMEFNHLLQIGAGMYHCGLQTYGSSVPVEDLFPANESWTRNIYLSFDRA